MLKRIISIVILASLALGSTKAYAQLTCEKDNKVSMNKDTQICCCKKDENNHYTCKPMTKNTGDNKCPGKISDTLTQAQKDEEAKHTIKMSTKENTTCTCGFTIQQ